MVECKVMRNQSRSGVSIIGATFTGNRGAEAMLTTVIAKIRESSPKQLFFVYSYYRGIDVKLVRDPFVTIYSAAPLYLLFILFPGSLIYAFLKFLRFTFLVKYFPASIQSLANSTVLLDISGVSFVDGREKFLPFNILTILPPVILKVPVIKLAQALGPFNNPLNKVAAKGILPHCKAIYARGEYSFRHLDNLGLSRQVIKSSSDLVFLRKTGSSLTKENGSYFKGLLIKLRKLKKLNGRIIGVCPSSHVYELSKKKGVNYLMIMSLMIRKLAASGKFLVIFPNASLPRQQFRNNDLKVIRILKVSLREEKQIAANVVYVSECINTDQIMGIIKMCDITVVSRFHAMIGSLSLKVPVIAVGWGHKYREVMKDFGQGKRVFDFHNFNLNKLIFSAEDAIYRKKEISNMIGSKLKKVIPNAEDQLKEVTKFL